MKKSIELKEERPPLFIGVVANQKEAFVSPSTAFANFTYFIRKKN